MRRFSKSGLRNVRTALVAATCWARRFAASQPPPTSSGEGRDDTPSLPSPDKISRAHKVTLQRNRPPPKGFRDFGPPSFPLPKEVTKENILQALELSVEEQNLLKLQAAASKRQSRKKRAVFLAFLGGLYYLFFLYRKKSMPKMVPSDEGYNQALVDFQSHSVVFIKDGKRIGRDCFISFKELQDRVHKGTEILVTIPTYFPLVPLLLLLMLPLLTGFRGGLEGAKRMAKKAAAAPPEAQRKVRFKKSVNVQTRLADVAGLTEPKAEVIEVIDFLKAPEKYLEMGAKLPKGILLDGPPGVGKTLLAKAIAGEAGLPFLSASGSEFEEVYVGVGAQRIRQLFKEAKEAHPCVVFIDEIDAFGRKRKSDKMGNARGTLNAFLSEIDGFRETSGILVLAATNRPDVLDTAMTRSGRFDRKITIGKPPHADRIAIAKVHLTPLKLDPSLSVENAAEALASLTPGCTGADIRNICNEAAIYASRDEKDFVEMDHFYRATERVLIGLEKKAKKLQPEERQRVAYHEAGHVVLAWFQATTDPVLKSTIVPRGASMIGVTQQLPQDVFIHTQRQLREKMIQKIAGYVSEEYFFTDLSTNAASDLQKVTELARNEVVTYGMDPQRVGHVGYDEQPDALTKPFGEAKENVIDSSVSEIVQTVVSEARTLLKQHLMYVRIVASLLLRNETLTAQELWVLLGDRPSMSKEFRKYLEA